MSWLLGVDLGQAADFTAIAGIEHDDRPTKDEDGFGRVRWEDHYTVKLLERPPLRTPYPDIVKRVSTIVHSPLLMGETQLVVDATGVGRPVVDMMREGKLEPTPISITGGQEVHHTPEGFWRVPKRLLVSAMAIALQTGRLHVVKSLRLAEEFTREAQNFKVKVSTTTAHDSYEAWRDGEHDDIVLAVALAIWWGERTPRGGWRGAEADAKERRRLAHAEKTATPWWRAREATDRGEGARWRK